VQPIDEHEADGRLILCSRQLVVVAERGDEVARIDRLPADPDTPALQLLNELAKDIADAGIDRRGDDLTIERIGGGLNPGKIWTASVSAIRLAFPSPKTMS
jgi:hypothetical protein